MRTSTHASSLFLLALLLMLVTACGESTPPPAADEETPANAQAAPIADLAMDRFRYVRRWGVREGEEWDQGLGPTHGGVVIDAAGAIYTSADRGIYVFDAEGTMLRSLEAEPLRGLHAMTLVEEEGQEVIFGAANNRAEFVKFRPDGEVLMTVKFPAESGVTGAYRPTGIAVTPSGNVLVADGYGTNFIYEFDGKGKYLRHFGGPGDEPGQFRTPHGIAIDHRFDPPRLLIADRERRRLVHYGLDGTFIAEVIGGLRRPCAVSVHGRYVAVAELLGRVAIVNDENALHGVLGDNPVESQRAQYGLASSDWKDGIHSAPHGLAWSPTGALYVQDWNVTGRLSKWDYRR